MNNIEKIHIVRISFHNAPDFILDKNIFEIEGGIDGLIKSGVFESCNYKTHSEETMGETEFFNLQPWEG